MQRRKNYKKEDKWGKQKTNSKVVALNPNYTRNYIKSRQLHTLIKTQFFGIKRKKYNPMLFIGYTP